MYTDPSGEFIFTALFTMVGMPFVGATIDAACLGAIIGGVSYSINTLFTDQKWTWKGFGNAAAIGAISGAATCGIGEIFGATGSVWNEVGRAGAHAVSNGTISHFSGGNFWQGFASGGLGSLAGSGFMMYGGDFANSTLGMYSFSAVSGGVGSVAAGGNFWEGAATGLMIAGLNHVKHKAEMYKDKIAGYKAIWEASLDANGNFERETSGFELKGGKFLMLPNDKNIMTESINPYSIIDGKNYAMYEGRSYEIIGHAHTHPMQTNPNGHPIGVSGADIKFMKDLRLKSVNIIYNRGIYLINGTSSNINGYKVYNYNWIGGW